MKQFRVDNLTSTYGEKVLFDHISFLITEGDHIGLIGVNGSGKTSLLNAIAGVTKADSGDILTQNDYRIGYLKQLPDLDPDAVVMDAILSGDQPVFKVIRDYTFALQRFSEQPNDDSIANQFEKAQAAMEQEDAWTTEAKIKTILTQLHMPDLQHRISELSGGQKSVLA